MIQTHFRGISDGKKAEAERRRQRRRARSAQRTQTTGSELKHYRFRIQHEQNVPLDPYTKRRKEEWGHDDTDPDHAEMVVKAQIRKALKLIGSGRPIELKRLPPLPPKGNR